MSLRLAYLVSQYPAINHTFILREIRALRQQGFDIEVVSIRPLDRPMDKLSPEERQEAECTWAVLSAGLPAISLAQIATLFSRPGAYVRGIWLAIRWAKFDLRATIFNLAYFAQAVTAGRRLQHRGFTHLHTHFSSTVALFLARVFPITFSATIHGPEEFDNATGFYLARKVADARFLCTISQYGSSQLMRASQPMHWHKIKVCPLGVDPSLFVPRPHRDQPERFEIFSVGRLAAAKAHAILIESVRLLVQSGRTQIRLRIAGGGPEYASLARRISESGLQRNVVLEGPCSQERVLQMYRETDLFAMPSFAEGVPVVLMEAMSMEIPCVATWIMGVPELIRHAQDGWLVPPASAEMLAEAMSQLMDDPALRKRLGRNGRLRVEDRYNLEPNTRLLAEIMAQWLAPRSGS